MRDGIVMIVWEMMLGLKPLSIQAKYQAFQAILIFRSQNRRCNCKANLLENMTENFSLKALVGLLDVVSYS